MTKTNLKGTKVYSVARAGDKPQEGLASRTGKIVEFKDGVNWVEWENGHKEPVWTINDKENFEGIGVYK